MSVSIDASDVLRFAVDLGRIESAALGDVDRILKRSAQSLKDRMVADAEASSSFRRIGRTITYDSAYRIGEPAYEIGPDRARGGAAGLAGAYLGWPNGGGASLPLDEPVETEGARLMFTLDQFLGGILS